MASNNNPNAVSGISIYQDKHGRNVYYDIFTKNGYLILDSTASKFNFYQKRIIFPIIVFALLLNYRMGDFYVDVYGALFSALAVFAGLEYFFRFHFLRSLTVIPNFQRTKKESYLVQLSNKNDKGKLIIKGLLYIIFAVLLFIYVLQSGYEGVALIGMGLICIFIGVYGLIYLAALTKIQSNQK